MNLINSISLVLAFLLTCCASSSAPSNAPALPYDFSSPDQVFELDKKLDEISGLEWFEGKLIALEDEEGEIYVLDPSSGSILDHHEFDEKGDYEGIAAIGSTIYALQSDGTVFVLSGLKGDKVDNIDKFETDIKNNCEGICLHPTSGKLLVACKDRGESADREVFELDPKNMEAKEHPVAYQLSGKEVENAIINTNFDKIAYAFNDIFTMDDFGGILNPSGIAVHPVSKEIYIVSGTSSLLVVLSADGKFKTAVPLPSESLPQPEAITFSPNGDLYIASEEANLSHGQLVKFSYHAK